MELPVLDFDAFQDALDERRRAAGMSWFELADELWDQSADLNAEREDDHPLCGGAVSRLRARGETSCQYALFMLRWLDRSPEEFLTGPVRDVGDTALPRTDERHRLRWDLAALHADVNEERRRQGLTWAALAETIGCTPARLTNLRTARMADLALVVRLCQWLGRPSAAYVGPATW